MAARTRVNGDRQWLPVLNGGTEKNKNDHLSKSELSSWFNPGTHEAVNPVEYLWSHWKQHELPNFCPTTFGQLSHYARQALRRMRRRPTLVIAFWQQAELFPM